jgi:hypothetical protein
MYQTSLNTKANVIATATAENGATLETFIFIVVFALIYASSYHLPFLLKLFAST